MRVVFAASEAVPFAKTGGLADVVGSLPREIERLGHEVDLFLPAYRCTMRAAPDARPAGISLEIPIAARTVPGELWQASLPGSEANVWLVKQDEYFDRPKLYGEGGRDYPDNCERFVFFCRAVFESLVALDRRVDLFHCHDWQTGLIPAYRNTLYRDMPIFTEAATLLTIHNVAYQGRFWHWDMLLTGLSWELFNWRQMEFHGDLNLLKTGIVFSDMLNTVSPSYAREIQHEPLGCGLADVLRHRADSLTGIVNGIDTEQWNPAADPYLPAAYGVENWRAGKATCKEALQRECGLEVDARQPLIGLIGRLASQKGWEIVLPVLEAMLPATPWQWVVLGSGEPSIESHLQKLARQYPSKLSTLIAFDERRAHRIEAASDIFVMASRYEPCGLNQLYSLRYGAVPVVHHTGGLIDTITDATAENLASGTATGFHFYEYESTALQEAIERAGQMYLNDPETWGRLVDTGMRQDWSWARSAQEYVALYERTRAKHLDRLAHH